MKRDFTVIIERDEDGYFIGTFPQLKGCYTQAKSLDQLMERMKEVVSLCLEVTERTRGFSLPLLDKSYIKYIFS